MTIKTNSPKPAAVAADGTMPYSPEQILDQLRVLREHVPDFGPLAASDASSMHAAANVPADLVQAAINTIGASPSVASALNRKPEVLLAEQDEAARWSAVEDELRAMLRGVSSANLARRYRLGLTALQTYNITRQLVRQKEHADLLPYVDGMRRLNRFGRRRRPATAEPAAPAPAPKQS